MHYPDEQLSALVHTATGPSTSHRDDYVTMADRTLILDTRFVHLTATRLRNILDGMAEEFFMDSLQ